MKKLFFLSLALSLTAGLQAQDWAKARLDNSPRHIEWIKVKHGDREVNCSIAYPEVKEAIVELDAKSANGKKYTKELALTFHQMGSAEKHKKYLKLLKETDPTAADLVETLIALDKDVLPRINGNDWKGAVEKLTPMLDKKGEAGQQVRWYAGFSEFKLGNKAKAIEHLEKGLALAPDSEFAKQMKEALESIK